MSACSIARSQFLERKGQICKSSEWDYKCSLIMLAMRGFYSDLWSILSVGIFDSLCPHLHFLFYLSTLNSYKKPKLFFCQYFLLTYNIHKGRLPFLCSISLDSTGNTERILLSDIVFKQYIFVSNGS